MPSTTITLSWPANPSEDGVTRYAVYESKDGSALAFKAAVAPSPVPSLNILNPLPGVYTWAVRAENFVGNSALSASATGPAIPSVPPAPTIVVTVS
jgi:hypothetical protein